MGRKMSRVAVNGCNPVTLFQYSIFKNNSEFDIFVMIIEGSGGDSDEELNEWESQQIRKGVSQAAVSFSSILYDLCVTQTFISNNFDGFLDAKCSQRDVSPTII